jgi:hypothetical protein
MYFCRKLEPLECFQKSACYGRWASHQSSRLFHQPEKILKCQAMDISYGVAHLHDKARRSIRSHIISGWGCLFIFSQLKRNKRVCAVHEADDITVPFDAVHGDMKQSCECSCIFYTSIELSRWIPLNVVLKFLGW